MLPRPAVLLFCLALLSATLHAQTLAEPSTYSGPPSNELILQWLHSPDPRLQSWGAHFVLTEPRPELLPEVTAAAEVGIASHEAEALPLAAELDTILQLNGTLPFESLKQLEGFETQRLILLSRLPWEEALPLWEKLYQPEDAKAYVGTRISAQMLALRPPPGFAAKLLATIDVDAVITVHDPKAGGIGFGSAGGCGGVGGGDLAADWPEFGSYAFLDPPKPGTKLLPNETLFLDAPDAVYVYRQLSRSLFVQTCGGFTAVNDAIRSHLVATLLGGSPAAPFPEQPITLDIPFRSREAYRAQVVSFVEAQQENFALISSALAARNLLTEQERQSIALRITLTLYDLRIQHTPDLPDIAFRLPVRWKAQP